MPGSKDKESVPLDGRCPVCGSTSGKLARSEPDIERELLARDEFYRGRFIDTLHPGYKKDVTDFINNVPVDIKSCAGCGLLIRRSRTGEQILEDYKNDPYEQEALERLFATYVDVFSGREDIRGFFSERSKPSIVEIGSHVGGFLYVARDWGWDALGIDVGLDVAEFSRRKGLKTETEDFLELDFPDSSIDAFFIWNCFEQLPDPTAYLEKIYRVLKPEGKLLLRLPNAHFYLSLARLSDPGFLPAGVSAFFDRALFFNNLAGFPHLYGFHPEIITRYLNDHSFQVDKLVGSSLIPVFHDLLKPEAAAELKETYRVLNSLTEWCSKQYRSPVFSPWIEIQSIAWGTQGKNRIYTVP